MSRIPQPYDRKHIFGSESSNNPSAPIQGTDLDAEFNAVEVAIDETQARLALIQRDDGQLANDSVGSDQLNDSAIVEIEDAAADAAQEVIDAGIIQQNTIYQQTVVAKDQAVAAKDAALQSANNANSSELNAKYWEELAEGFAQDAEESAVDSAASADMSRYYYSELSGTLDALSPRTVIFDGNSGQASYQLPVPISDEEFLDVFIGGLAIDPALYSVTGSTITFTPPPATGVQNVMVKIAGSVQIMPIVVDDWGLITESAEFAEDWGSIVA
jgi:hypothetical protein